MSESETKTIAELVLPPNVVSKLDVARLVDEAERVDNELTTTTVRAKAGAETPAAPAMSGQLADFLEQNQLDVTDSHRRSELIKQLHKLKEQVPVVHATFAAKADNESLQQITAWLRKSAHPQAVIEVGLQPALVAGVYLRTPNRVHDFSLRAQLEKNRGTLIKEVEALRGAN